MEVKRIPSTSLAQSQAMQFINENTIKRFPQVAFVYSRSGTPDLAADPMPPSATDTYVILKPREEWPDPQLPKNDLIREISDQAGKLPGNKVSFSQPIQMRFNELIAGVRQDLAVSVFGEEFEPMLRVANQIAAVLEGTRGIVEVKVEDVTGMPVLEIGIEKAEISRHGLSLDAVQDVIGIAVGGRPAGLVFEGDRRFQIVVRLSDDLRNNIEVLKNLPIPLPPSAPGEHGATIPLRVLADFNLSEGPNQVSRENGKRRVVVTADVRGRDIGSAVTEAQAKIAQKVTLPPVFCADILLAAGSAGVVAGRAAGVQRRAAGPHRGCRGVVAARHGILDLLGGRVHRAVGCRRAQRPRHDHVHPAACRRRRAAP
jgi:cobalt-zinc-cadmium resistance protein CzcA